MHVLEIDRDEDELVQGFVRAEWPGRADLELERANAWIRLFLRSASLWSQAKPLSAAVRILIEPDCPVTTVHSFVVAKRDEPRLRLLLAAFMRTDRMGAGHTEGPQPGVDLAGQFVHPDDVRIAMVRETLSTGNGIAIHHNLRLADHLPRLMQTFADLGVPFAYEFQATPWIPPRDLLKTFLHNVSRLADETGVPQRLVDDQVALGGRLKQAVFHVEECICVRPPASVDTVGETLSALLADSLYSSFNAIPRIEVVDPTRAEAFGHHVHSFLANGTPLEASMELAAAATREDVGRCISCLPLGVGSSRPASSHGPEPEPLALNLDPPSGPGLGPQSASRASATPFLFVSYARADGDRVFPLVDQIAQNGAALWIDRRIVGGDDWIAELEAQLMKCSGVVAFVSPSFAGSRYCCREVRFADALNKKIIPVFLTDVSLAAGMNFILHEIQRVTVDDSCDCRAIVAAIRKHVPATCFHRQ